MGEGRDPEFWTILCCVVRSCLKTTGLGRWLSGKVLVCVPGFRASEPMGEMRAATSTSTPAGRRVEMGISWGLWASLNSELRFSRRLCLKTKVDSDRRHTHPSVEPQPPHIHTWTYTLTRMWRERQTDRLLVVVRSFLQSCPAPRSCSRL